MANTRALPEWAQGVPHQSFAGSYLCTRTRLPPWALEHVNWGHHLPRGGRRLGLDAAVYEVCGGGPSRCGVTHLVEDLGCHKHLFCRLCAEWSTSHSRHPSLHFLVAVLLSVRERQCPGRTKSRIHSFGLRPERHPGAGVDTTRLLEVRAPASFQLAPWPVGPECQRVCLGAMSLTLRAEQSWVGCARGCLPGGTPLLGCVRHGSTLMGAAASPLSGHC